MCTHEHNEQNGKKSVLGQGACFISFKRCERCEMGARRGCIYLTENIASPSVLLQHRVHQMSVYYFILEEKKPSKQISLASRHTGRTKIASLQVTTSVYLFTWKINGNMVTEVQHKVSIEVVVAGHISGMEVVREKSPVASWPY